MESRWGEGGDTEAGGCDSRTRRHGILLQLQMQLLQHIKHASTGYGSVRRGGEDCTVRGVTVLPRGLPEDVLVVDYSQIDVVPRRVMSHTMIHELYTNQRVEFVESLCV